MNREEFATKIQDLVNRAYLADIPKSYYEGLFDEAEKLRQPITLAEFLGWEEGIEYRRGGSYFKIEGNHLLHKGHSGKWVNMNLQTWELIDLRQATKVEPKLKAYHVTDEYSYECLMKELEEQGCTTKYGTKPMEVDYWWNHKQKTVIYCDEDKNITYSHLSYYETDVKDKYDLIEYKKEEPKFYAIDRIGKLDNDSSFYLTRYYDELSKRYYFGTIEKESADKLTKKDWNELGINDTNVDFEEVKE